MWMNQCLISAGIVPEVHYYNVLPYSLNLNIILVDKPALSVALWNMALRVEAEMAFPTGGAVVSRSGVELSGVIQGSMWWSSQVETGQDKSVHLRSRRRPSLPGLRSAQEECLAGSKDLAVGGQGLRS